MTSVEPKKLNWFQATERLIREEAERNGVPAFDSVVALSASRVVESENGGPVFGCVLASLEWPAKINLACLPEGIGLQKARRMALQITNGQRKSPFP